jgi:glycosyltransferase involved in cell wall biosynthesis
VPLLLYLWDLPPWRLAGGRPDVVFELRGRVRRVPRPVGRYPERAGYYSRIGFVARRAAEVWCPSEGTVADVRARFGVAARRVPFCYDSDRFGPGAAPRPSRPPEPPSLLAIGRLVPHKNVATLIRAAALVPGRPRVRVLGEGPEAAALRRLADELGVALELPGRWAEDEAIVAAYRAASVVVAPSRFEGFGLTPIEGLAMGAPVVASDIPAHREFLDGAARFFPPDDPAALAGELSALLLQPSAVPPFRPSACLSALTIESCAARFLPGLERLLGAAR